MAEEAYRKIFADHSAVWQKYYGMIVANLLHSTALLAHRAGYRAFRHALADPEGTQREKLRQYSSLSYEAFARNHPITTYEDWSDWVEKLRASPDAPRFEPTSGSTSRRKWIPYTPAFTRELDLAASAWITDLAKEAPRITRGRHYWSISWLPDDLRSRVNSTDDTRIFTGLKQRLISAIMATPEGVATLPSLEQSRRACAAYLAAARDLSLLSVWSPTFGLELIAAMGSMREELASVLSTGRWDLPLPAPKHERQAAILRRWDGKPSWAFTRELWPELALVSSWDSSTSADWALELRALFPHAAFQGKGLWATEGVVTIPFENRYPVALTSHFLEFKNAESGKVLPVWELEEGMRLQPILTTGSGFKRYALPDLVEVTGMLERTPCLRFLGRLHGVDLVGEKIDAVAATDLLRELSVPGERECVSLLATRSPGAKPGYVLLARGSGEEAALSSEIERRLLAFHHYRLARELGQLEPARALLRSDALVVYERLRSGSRIPGSLKIEPVTLVEGPLHG